MLDSFVVVALCYFIVLEFIIEKKYRLRAKALLHLGPIGTYVIAFAVIIGLGFCFRLHTLFMYMSASTLLYFIPKRASEL